MATPAALAALGSVIGVERAQLVVASVDWRVLKAVFEARRERPFLRDVAAQEETGGTPQPAAAGRTSLQSELAAARPDGRLEIAEARVRAEAAAVLGLDPQQVDMQQGLFDMGMDSLMSVELKTRLEKCAGRRLPTTLTFNYPSIAALAEFLVKELQPVERDARPAETRAASAVAPPVAAAPIVTPAAAVDADDLSEEEL